MNDYISHHGVKGQKWGVRRYQKRDGTRTAAGKSRENEKLTKQEKKAIRKKKNDLLNATVQVELETESYVSDKLSVKNKKFQEDYFTEEVSKEKLSSYVTEYSTHANKYIADNPGKVPAGMTIKYRKDVSGIDGDDLTMHPDVTYNGKSFTWGVFLEPSDRVFLEEPKIQHSEFPDYISHHGVKGQKWGVRRYQKRDGTRTPAGRAKRKNEAKEAASKMSDSDLRNAINRMNMEKQYSNLVKERDTSKGVKAVTSALKTIGSVAAVTSTIVTLHSNSTKIAGLVSKAASKVKGG